MAVLTLSIVSFLVVLPPLAVSDLMILDQIDISERARLGQRLALRVGVITTIAIVALSPIIASLYSKYSFGVLAGLIMVVSLRPTSEAFAVGPLSRLRVGSRYRAIAIIDGSAQFLATLIMVSLAFLGAGAPSFSRKLLLLQFERFAIGLRSVGISGTLKIKMPSAQVLE